MSATVTLTSSTFNETIENNDLVVIDFWAEWCGPCRRFAPVFEEVAAANPGVVFGKVDTEAERDIAEAFQIRSIPTLMLFREGVLLFAQPGALPQAALEDLVRKAGELDMDDVRAQLAEAGQPSAD